LNEFVRVNSADALAFSIPQAPMQWVVAEVIAESELVPGFWKLEFKPGISSSTILEPGSRTLAQLVLFMLFA
jgi:hypothetical protein